MSTAGIPPESSGEARTTKPAGHNTPHRDPRDADSERGSVVDQNRADDRGHDRDTSAIHDDANVMDRDRGSVVDREKDQYGGIKFGSAFFGWLTATGTVVLLTALVAAAGAAVGVASDTDIAAAASDAASDPQSIGIAGGIALLVVVLLSYFCGGYVAGRMARFNGLKQGLAVWLWAVVIAALVALAAYIAGDQFNILGELNAFPRIPIDEGDLTTGGLIALAVVAVASLVGALLGGLAGMRFHRKVDKAGLGS